MMNHSKAIMHVGMDVHKNTIAVAWAVADGGEPTFYGTIDNRPKAVRKLADRLSGGDTQVLRFYYEAGPCGYGLHRQLTELGHACQVVAPALIPQKPGDRIKTDRRDAMNLAGLGRGGQLTAVHVPDSEQEAMRDLMRCREDAKAAQRQGRQQLTSFLLRYGRVFSQAKTHWSKTHFRWLADQKFEVPLQQIVFQEYVDAVTAANRRVQALDQQIQESVQEWKYKPVVDGLRALRGVDLIAAMTIVAELGDVRRFESPLQLMKFLGLVPREHSSGMRIHRGPITKAGNGHVRRILIEAGWCYRWPARMTKHMKDKSKDASPQVEAIAWKAQKRLCARYRKMTGRGKENKLVTTAIARELCGFIWAIYKQVMDSGAGSPRPPVGARSGEPSATL